MSSSTAPDASTKKTSPLDSTAHVFVPYAEELFFDRLQFDTYLRSLALLPTSASVPQPGTGSSNEPTPSNKFMDALKSAEPTLPANLTYTENGAYAHESTDSSLLDLFSELEKTVASERLVKLLDAAWAESPLDTLKIIWNARSIHVGKGERDSWYRCLGWLKDNHPLTLLVNLEWAVRPVIEKKMKKENGEGEEVGGDAMIVDEPNVDLEDANDITRFDVKNGVSHGYYCDLVNILMLAVHESLDAMKDPKSTLQTPKVPRAENSRRHRQPAIRGRGTLRGARAARGRGGLGGRRVIGTTDEERAAADRAREEAISKHLERTRQEQKIAKERKKANEKASHERFLNKFNADHFYRALHLHVARIFASALQTDIELLNKGTKKDINDISLAAKWAPGLEKAHDRATFVASTIAELLFPPEKIRAQEAPREVYLKYAREHYRRLIAKLRKALDVVELKITARRFAEISYNRVPSIAMDNYKSLFASNDLERFEQYLSNVAAGKASISGAVMLPSKLVHQARTSGVHNNNEPHLTADLSGKQMEQYIKQKVAQLESKVVDAQWNSLVQRIRDSGTLDNALAVCDVSGSMTYPNFADGTCPMDSAIGLSLVLAQTAKPPFDNAFITFSANPAVVRLDPSHAFSQLVNDMNSADWAMNTDFNAVFERLLLPLAVNNKIPREDMVKRVFVFSDMQFDAAQSGTSRWETNYQRIKRLYEDAGYDVPDLVFWNLAARAEKKPVTKDMEGTALVSGYSQAMLKVFLDKGGFDEEVEEEVVEMETAEDGVVVEVVKTARKIDPLSTVKKAIGHASYSMLRVVD